ncbi:Rne/Rng family ribonuclease [Alisedimentitalea sp. MJ-SS2]|uniref:Rne/Rng family ribonuclease n=1 Tax=Aliisedimentitalea sp. MJ-SS2 TaxID=3049795 RepID=UPI002915680D|nr:Rne/Rng family ribonuclease [Alisedimentitalea sp. MJ-SS2]MDU8926838.1 Rne/Rng family ribonuclease [Alisedimentitalea sp. MJ-SS2]
MAKKMLIDATHTEETRVVVVDGNKVEEFDFESENKRQLAGNIYLAKVTRVEPSLQAAFVDYGGNRHGFLAFSEIHPDYYQIPVADREALMEEERAYAEAMKAREDEEEKKPRRRRRSRAKAASADNGDAVETKEVETPEATEDSGQISGMETIDLDEGGGEAGADTLEGHSPMDLVAETPVEEPNEDAEAEAADAEAPADTEEANDEAADAVAEAPVEETGESAENVEEATEAKDDAAEGDAEVEASGEDDDEDEDDDTPSGRRKRKTSKRAASDRDASIESVADDDDQEDIRPPRKPRPRRYKIQEVVKVRQILLVQVVKEERGNKGAALTTYLSLAGRYCVLMPNTARGGGISRKITNAADRKKLKTIAGEIDVPQGAGLIVRTAGAKRTKTEIKRDYEYLQRLWEQIRELTLKSIAPAKIYEEGDLIKRSIRDLYSREIDEVLVEGERGYRIAKDFMKMIMPSHAKNVKQYGEAMPLFARYQVESYLSSMFNPTVQLKSGGYIVIGVTEALVAIDVNSGRATKEGSIEETATKTNLEAAEEVARQLRLRDLAGLIVIDFIDMDERKNNNAVEKRLKDKLKTDRARIQVGRISGFGLLEMSRQRLRPGMIEATTQPCPACHGTGLIRSDDNLALSILRQIEEEGTRGRSREVLVKCPVGISNFLMNQKREHIAQIEARYGLSVRVEGDPMLISPDFALEKFKTATRVVPEASAPVVSVDTSLMAEIDSNAEEEAQAEAIPAAEGDEEQKPRKRRRRRRRRKPSQGGAEGETQEAQDSAEEEAATEAGEAEAQPQQAPETTEGEAEEKPARRRRRSKKVETEVEAQTEGTEEAKPEEAAEEQAEAKPKRTRRRSTKKTTEDAGPVVEAKPEETTSEPEAAEAEAEKPKKRTRRTAKSKAAEESADAVIEAAPEVEAEVEEKPKPKRRTRKAKPKVEESVAAQTPVEAAPEPAAEPEPAPAMAEAAAPEPVATAKADEPPKPKRKGWWSLGKS